MEIGQLIHNNPGGYPASAFVRALMDGIRNELSRVYWNVHQRQFYGDADACWNHEVGEPPLGVPGMEWWPYYNWSGHPSDPDWDQAEADRANFSYEGVEFRWYKRYGRSLNVNVQWPAEKWERWYERAIQTIAAWADERQPTLLLGRAATSYPDPAGAVPL